MSPSVIGLAPVGVQAVVEGLKSFKSMFDTMNDALDKFASKGSLLSKVFQPVNKALGMFFESLRRIGEFVIAGVILRGIDAITNAVREMAMAVFDAAVEFQLLKIRLETFLATEFVSAGTVGSLSEALQMAVEPAKELFDWMLKLAMTTPFDTQDVADTFTMAKAWGFATEEAKKLTIQVSDFAAGMGFGALEMDRVIKALGQMKSLGRVAGQELLQLANAGVPVADIMRAIQEELGLTNEEFQRLRHEGGVSAEMFFEQWDKLVSERFEGAAIRASKTITGVIGNIKDLITGIGGMKVVVPILDVIAAKLDSFLQALTTGENFDRLLEITEGLGTALADITELFLGELPSPEGLASNFLDFLENLKNALIGMKPIIDEILAGTVTPGQGISAILQLLGINEETAGKLGTFVDKLTTFKDTLKDIITAFKEEGFMAGLEAAGVPAPILNFFGLLGEAFENLVTFWDQNKDTIKEIISGVLSEIAKALGFQIDTEKVSLIESLGNILLGLSQWVLENPDKIIEWIIRFGLWIQNIIGILSRLATWVNENRDRILLFLERFGLGLYGVWLMAKVFAGVTALVGAALIALLGWFINIGALINQRLEWIAALFRPEFWYQIGQLMIAGMRNGVIIGILNMWGAVYPWLIWFVNLVKAVFGFSSPSKVFADIGEGLMEGMKVGIERAMILPEFAMKTAVKHIIEPAMSPLMSSGTTNNTTTNNFSLNISTQAKAEPIIADFRMMQSLAGGG